MDNQIAFDALTSAVKASEVLGVDEAERKEMQQLISQIPPMQIGKYGQLQEWLVDCVFNGIAAPCFFSALSYFDGLRNFTSAANLIQAQRDYFGAHTYERTDVERGIYR